MSPRFYENCDKWAGGGDARQIPLTSGEHGRPVGRTSVNRMNANGDIQYGQHYGFFLLGDAAASLDPSSSHGVLRALMSGILVGHLVERHHWFGVKEARVIDA